MKYIATLVALLAGLNAGAQIIDTTLTGSVVNINLNLSSLASTIHTMQAEISTLQAYTDSLESELTFLAANQDFQDIELIKMRLISDSVSLCNDYMWHRFAGLLNSPGTESLKQLVNVGIPALNSVMSAIDQAIMNLSNGTAVSIGWENLEANITYMGEWANVIDGDLGYPNGQFTDKAAFLDGYFLGGLSGLTKSTLNTEPDYHYEGDPIYTDFGPMHFLNKRFYTWPKDVKGHDIASGMDAPDIDLSGANLVGADLVDATLHGVDFSDAYLMYADLSNGDFTDGDFSGTNLANANLSGAILAGATFSDDSYPDQSNPWHIGATLTGANIVGCTNCPCYDVNNDDLCD